MSVGRAAPQKFRIILRLCGENRIRIIYHGGSEDAE
jgi:hypothetical protein